MSTKNFINKKNHIKRPPNAFILWSSEQRRVRHITDKNNIINNARMSELLGAEWSNLSEETRLKYRDKAKLKKVEHKRNFPDYKYEPRSRLKSKPKSNPKAQPKPNPKPKPNTKKYSQLKKNIENIKENSDDTRDENSYDTINDTSTVNINPLKHEINKISIVNKISMFDIMNSIYIINARFAQDSILDQTTTILMDHILADKTNFNFLTELKS